MNPQSTARRPVALVTGGSQGARILSETTPRALAALPELQQAMTFLEAPRVEPYGTVAVFVDLYGTKWDLLEPAA